MVPACKLAPSACRQVCGSVSDPVVQQFKYCEPRKCKNASCPNTAEWRLQIAPTSVSRFVDWQRVRVQVQAAGENGVGFGLLPLLCRFAPALTSDIHHGRGLSLPHWSSLLFGWQRPRS
eukprot:scaffold4978_cov117-Isochrysis_galbana.AAC.4